MNAQHKRRKPDRWTTATCRQETHQQWARQHHGSLWDYQIDGEPTKQRQKRHQTAITHCLDCPLFVQCDTKHQQLIHQTGAPVPGVWAGRIHEDSKTLAQRRTRAAA